MRSFSRMARLMAALALAAFAGTAAAQTDNWPNRTIRLVSPFPPGGTTDLLARLLAPPLSKALGQQVIVENRAGGGGSIGTGIVAKAAPDGYTFVIVFDTHAVNPSLIPNMPFDTRNDLAPVMLIATGAMVVTAHNSQPYRSFSALVAAAREKPGAISYGTIGSGSLAHLAMTQMNALGRFSTTHVPYKGGGPLAQDAIAGHVPIAMATSALLSPHIRSGVLVPLAVTSAQRDPALPNVPTVSEQGIPGFEALAWWGMFAPARTPPAIIQRVNAEVAAALRDPSIRERLTGQGMNLLASSPEDLGRFLDPQMTRWAGVVREYGIRAGD
jgi:tripartite-type tricarboxylate transporter receptor subunit TctC